MIVIELYDHKPDFKRTTAKLISAVQLPIGLWRCEVERQ